MGAGIEKGRGLILHISPYVVPCLGDLVLGEINLIGDLLVFFVGHGFFLSGAQAPIAMDYPALETPYRCMLGTESLITAYRKTLSQKCLLGQGL
jgi:hypothetical protein